MTASGASNLRVIIIGGGPAGTSCALRLNALARQGNHNVDVTLLEAKRFETESHYNQCVGVLSPPLPSLLEEALEVPFPHHLGRAEIDGYVLHAGREQILLEDPNPSIALRRVQFDAYMLGQVQARGIRVIRARAVDVERHTDRVLLYTDAEPVEGDVVVGAFGLDEGCAAIFARSTPYRPPKALESVVTKYHPGEQEMAAFGSRIHAFLPADPKIEFGGITPKGNHLTINIAGLHVDAPALNGFLRSSEVRRHLPNLDQAGSHDPNDLRAFKGRFPRARAAGYYGERYIIIGDAAGLVRSFKGKGVTTAILTGIRAAEAIWRYGATEAAFGHAYRQANKDLLKDLPYGRLVRRLTILLSRHHWMEAILRAAKESEGLREALRGAVSGAQPYRQVLALATRPNHLAAILRHLRPAKPEDTATDTARP